MKGVRGRGETQQLQQAFSEQVANLGLRHSVLESKVRGFPKKVLAEAEFSNPVRTDCTVVVQSSGCFQGVTRVSKIHFYARIVCM